MVERTNGSGFAQRASSVGSDVLCPESAASPASGGWFGMRPSGAYRAGQPRRARWFEVAAKKPMRGFVPREHNLAPFGFRTRESAVCSTSEVEQCGIPGSQRRQRRGAPIPANGRRFMSRQGWGACSFWSERIGACRRPIGDGRQQIEGGQLFIGEP